MVAATKNAISREVSLAFVQMNFKMNLRSSLSRTCYTGTTSLSDLQNKKSLVYFFNFLQYQQFKMAKH